MREGGGEPIRTIVVVGGGVVGLSAALVFSRALPNARVTVVGVPPPPGALADRLPVALPATRSMLDLMGVDEAELVHAGGATHRLAERFSHWRRDGAAWLHGSGETGTPGPGGAFHQRWLEAYRGGSPSPFHAYSAAAAVAEAGRFVPPGRGDRLPLSQVDHALRLDPVATARLLVAQARRGGVALAGGPTGAVTRRADGGIETVHLAGGHVLAADLFVDCSGPARLLSEPDDWIDWSEALPVDRLLLAAGPGTPSPLDVYEANDIGWRAAWPLRDRMLTALAYADALTPEPHARRVMGSAGEMAEAIAIVPGRQRSPWRGNVLALGDAAVAAGPLGLAGFALAQTGLTLALELLPGRDLHPLLLAEYNRRAGLRADRVRDFLALHYLASRRTAGQFWRHVGAASPPTDAALALATFARHGHLPRHDEELFDKASWLAVLFGLGLVPAHRDPMETEADPAELREQMARLRAAVAMLPTYADYLAQAAAA